MTSPDGEGAELERLLAILAKLYAAVETSGDKCPLCIRSRTHSTGCPLRIAWGLLDEELHEAARQAVRDLTQRHSGESPEGDLDWPDFLSDE